MKALDQLANRIRLTFHQTMLGARPVAVSRNAPVVERHPLAGKLTSSLPAWTDIDGHHKKGWRAVAEMVGEEQQAERAALRDLAQTLGCEGTALIAEVRRLLVAVKPPSVKRAET